MEGRLDGSGEVIIPDTGIAAVTIETLPDVDKEIRELREAIRKEMDDHRPGEGGSGRYTAGV